MDLGKYIIEKRALHKLTQQELAERSGVGVRFVRELEHGKPTVQLDKVNHERIYQEVSISKLFR